MTSVTEGNPDVGLVRLRSALRDVRDFPKPGIVFKDITPILGDADLLRQAVGVMAAPFRGMGITHVAGIESRGFILAGPIALALEAGFVPVRKPGKLPWTSMGVDYDLEYGTDRLEMHVDAFPPPSRVLLVDDVLASGGTASAACELIKRVGGMVVGCSFLVAITSLAGKRRLGPVRIEAVLDV